MQFPSILPRVEPMPEPIFRSVQVGTGQSLTLGEPIPADVMPLVQFIPPDRYQLRPGTFHRAQTITVQVADGRQDGPVQRMDFTYDPGTSYEGLLQEYTAELGPPAQDNSDAPPAERRSLWEDPETTFELYAQGAGPNSQVGSTLQDRAAA